MRNDDDFGLYPVHDEDAADKPGARFTTQTGQVIELRSVGDPSLPAPLQDGPSLREIVWGVDTQEALDTLAADRTRSCRGTSPRVT